MTHHSPEDAIDQALDGSMEPPEWLQSVDARLRSLDAAFAPRRTTKSTIAPPLPVRSAQGSRWRPAPLSSGSAWRRLPSLAALLALILVAGYAIDAQLERDPRPSRPSVSAVGTPDQTQEQPVVVTPSACILPVVSQEDLEIAKQEDLAVETPDPIEPEVDPELLDILDPVVRDGRIVFAGGAAAPDEISAQVTAVLADFIACSNAGRAGESMGFMSSALIAQVSFANDFISEVGATPTPLANPTRELIVDNMRLLPDGRVAAVVQFVASKPPGFEHTLEPTPDGTVGLHGNLYVFVKTDAGWRLDVGTAPGEYLRLPATGSEARIVATVAPFVVAPSDCILAPVSLRQVELTLQSHGIELSALPQPTNEAGRTAAEEDLRAYYVDLLDREVRDGEVIFTVGQPANAQTADEITQLMRLGFGCMVDGKPTAWLQLFSIDYLALMAASLEPPLDNTPVPEEVAKLLRFEFSQFRVLPDGRVMVVVMPVRTPGTESLFDLTPMATPANSVAPEGAILIFVTTSDLWAIDFQIEPDAFRMPLPTINATPTASQP